MASHVGRTSSSRCLLCLAGSWEPSCLPRWEPSRREVRDKGELLRSPSSQLPAGRASASSTNTSGAPRASSPAGSWAPCHRAAGRDRDWSGKNSPRRKPRPRCRPRRDRLIGEEGVVTLSKRRCEAGLLGATSRGGDCFAPRAHRRGAKRAMRLGRNEMALAVEGTENGGIPRKPSPTFRSAAPSRAPPHSGRRAPVVTATATLVTLARAGSRSLVIVRAH